MAIFDQSVASTVGKAGLKLRTPSSHCFTTSCLEDVKVCSSSSDQLNADLEERRWQKGWIIGDAANAYNTWATAPNQLQMPLRLAGVKKLRMDSLKVAVGWKPVIVMLKPIHSTSS